MRSWRGGSRSGTRWSGQHPLLCRTGRPPSHPPGLSGTSSSASSCPIYNICTINSWIFINLIETVAFLVLCGHSIILTIVLCRFLDLISLIASKQKHPCNKIHVANSMSVYVGRAKKTFNDPISIWASDNWCPGWQWHWPLSSLARDVLPRLPATDTDLITVMGWRFCLKNILVFPPWKPKWITRCLSVCMNVSPVPNQIRYRVSFIQHLKVVRHIDSSAIPRTGYN